MRVRLRTLLALAASLLVPRIGSAQEPKPARIDAVHLEEPQHAILDYAWRFQPGEDPRGADPSLDDGAWRPVRPALPGDDLPQGWPGAGWFRRHVRFEPALHGRQLAVRVEAPGIAEVFLDGIRLSSAKSPRDADFGFLRRESYVFTVPDHEESVLAVHYTYTAPPGSRFTTRGFVLEIARPGSQSPVPSPLVSGLQGGAVALPIFLTFLHLALFAFYPRAKENLWYALETAVFSVLILRDYAEGLGISDAARAALSRFSSAPLAAIFFGILTYHAIRLGRLARSVWFFAVSGVALTVGSWFFPSSVSWGWVLYFAAFVVEIFRVERSGRVVPREGVRFFTNSLAVLGLFLVLQGLINFQVIPSVAGATVVYVFGILASAVGMSLFLARTFGSSRMVEAESARKTRELEEARALQLSMLPGTLPTVPGLDLAAATTTATEVGGDYYDLRIAPDGSLLVAFGDATGHGLASGIVVTAAKALFGALDPAAPLVDSLSACDRVLRGMRFGNFQMCLALARLTPRGAALASAAMPPALVHRASNGAVEELGTGGLPLGSRLTGSWAERTASLATGDTLLLASDGFPELLDANGRVLGFTGAAQAFARAAARDSAIGVLESLNREVTTWRTSRPPDDDITFLVVRVAG